MENQKLLESLSELKARLDRVEGFLTLRTNYNPSGSARPTDGKTPAPPPATAPVPPSVATPEMPTPPAPRYAEDDRPTESLQFGNFLGIVGIICFILAAAYLVKLSIDSGWLTPANRILLAGLFGLALIVTGTRKRFAETHYMSLLPAAGVVVLYLTVAAGYGLYDLYSPTQTVAMMGAVSVLCLFLYSLFHAPIYAVVAVVGTYLSVFLTPSVRDVPTLSTYFFIWDLTFAVVAVQMRSRVMILLASYLSLWLFQVGFHSVWAQTQDQALYLALYQVVQFFIFLIATATYSMKNQSPMTAAETWSFFPLLIFFYGLEYATVKAAFPAVAPWIALGFAALIYLAYAVSKRSLGKETLASAEAVSTFITIVAVHALYLQIFDFRWQLWSPAVALALFPFLLSKRGEGKVHYGPLFILGGVFLFAYLRAILAFDPLLPLERIGLGFTYFVILGWFYLTRVSPTEGGEFHKLALAFGHAQFFAATIRLWHWAQKQFFLPYEITHAGLSLTWAVMGLVILLWAKARRDALLAYSAMGLLGAGTAKVLLYDVAGSAPLIRIACLLALGAILYFCGYQFRVIEGWKKSAQ